MAIVLLDRNELEDVSSDSGLSQTLYESDDPLSDPSPFDEDDASEDVEITDPAPFLYQLALGFIEDRDANVRNELLNRLGLFKRVAKEMMRRGCEANNYRIAQDFLKTIDVAENLTEKLWDFHGKK